MNLYHKRRPTSIKDVLGNTSQVKSFKKDVTSEDPSHVYMLSGPRGVGKTTLARIAAPILGAEDTSIIEYDCAKFPKVEDMRDTLEQVSMLPMSGRASIFIFDEAHRLTPQSQETLLKTLEETPEHVYIFICTSKPNKVDSAVISRCTHIKLAALQKKTINKLLSVAAVEECLNEEVVTEDVIEEISRSSEGSARTALQTLEQVSRLDSEEEALEVASTPVTETAEVYDLFELLVAPSTVWKKISSKIKELKNTETGESMIYAILGIASTRLLSRSNKKVAVVLEVFSELEIELGIPSLVLGCFRVHNI